LSASQNCIFYLFFGGSLQGKHPVFEARIGGSSSNFATTEFELEVIQKQPARLPTRRE
jgi:hypothetical protein